MGERTIRVCDWCGFVQPDPIQDGARVLPTILRVWDGGVLKSDEEPFLCPGCMWALRTAIVNARSKCRGDDASR